MKLYEQFKNLKLEDNSKFYLFHSGIFYVFLDKDAVELAPLLNLKILPFTKEIVKCGFPQKSFSKYKDILDDNKINYQIVENNIDKKEKLKLKNNLKEQELEIIKMIKKIDICKLTPLEAFNILVKLKEKVDDEQI